MKNGIKAENEKRTSPPSGEAEKIRIEREKQTRNPYYLKVSRGYKAAKFFALALFVGYLIVMMCMYRSSITYDNLMYLIRDFETDVDVSSTGFENVNYSESEKMSFAMYKDRLALATGAEFTLYNTTGSVELEYDHSMENPKVETGEKYALVYDVGGTSYSIYNTIARVSTKHTDFAIQGADISESGAFSMITRSKENRYVVSLYDSSFRELLRVYKDKYVTDVGMSADGKKYALVSCDVKESDFITEVVSGSVYSDASVAFELSGLLPLSVDWFDSGDFVAVCDGAAVFVSSEGELKTKYEFSGMRLTSAHVSGDKLLLTGSENIVGSSSVTVLLDKDGAVIDRFSYDGKITSVVLSENFAFCLAGEEIIKRGADGSMTVVECPAYVKTIVPCFDNIAVCTGTTVTMGFESKQKVPSTEGFGDDTENTVENPAEDTAEDTVEDTVEDTASAEETLDVELDVLG